MEEEVSIAFLCWLLYNLSHFSSGDFHPGHESFLSNIKFLPLIFALVKDQNSLSSHILKLFVISCNWKFFWLWSLRMTTISIQIFEVICHIFFQHSELLMRTQLQWIQGNLFSVSSSFASFYPSLPPSPFPIFFLFPSIPSPLPSPLLISIFLVSPQCIYHCSDLRCSLSTIYILTLFHIFTLMGSHNKI